MSATLRKRGFTLVEVMVSLGVMTIGAMALFGMQQQAVRANVHARELTTATQVAQIWIERLKLDALRWTNASGVPATDLAGTDFLKIVAQNGVENTFQTIPITSALSTALPGGPGLSNGFDVTGRDVINLGTAVNMANVRYCASYRLAWVYFNRAGLSDNRALRADVRVWWPKERQVVGNKATGNTLSVDFNLCADDNARLNPGTIAAPTPGTEYNNYHIVYLSTVLRPN